HHHPARPADRGGRAHDGGISGDGCRDSRSDRKRDHQVRRRVAGACGGGIGKVRAGGKRSVCPWGGQLMAEMMYWEAIRRAQDEELARDPLVIVMGEDVGVAGGTYKATQGLYDKYGPERVIDTPISENSF